ncbi:sensor histidine kinase [Paenibacillus cremeus]|uniref:histidine kinase n=1 Tax=Paenibacillus cremeus TaxID=2163881 RepID=A0A559JPW7_9BACL|nr:HAMP domain-containing sensor histidine kinase [Paenibacillus cremeus]TVY01917.1 HAMP domain-containing histidine kinase [Paenibacillus cremeus]
MIRRTSSLPSPPNPKSSEIDFYKSKLDFAHVVSHEVRNPLTVIRGFANILRHSEKNLSPAGLEKLDAIGRYTKAIDQELTHIIQTEQMLSTDLYVKMEWIHPYETVQEVIELMNIKSYVENVQLVTHIELTTSHAMMGNLMGLRLILSNLVSNAIKYAGEQGSVTFSAFAAGDLLRFVVQDNGIGMSSDQLNSLFQKYGKLNEHKNGQGIGLYVVKNLVDRFHGTIQFESELGSGTTVTVDIPMCASTDDAGHPEAFVQATNG